MRRKIRLMMFPTANSGDVKGWIISVLVFLGSRGADESVNSLKTRINHTFRIRFDQFLSNLLNEVQKFIDSGVFDPSDDVLDESRSCQSNIP